MRQTHDIAMVLENEEVIPHIGRAAAAEAAKVFESMAHRNHGQISLDEVDDLVQVEQPAELNAKVEQAKHVETTKLEMLVKWPENWPEKVHMTVSKKELAKKSLNPSMASVKNPERWAQAFLGTEAVS